MCISTHLNLRSGWKWKTNLTLRPHYPAWKYPGISLNMRLDGPPETPWTFWRREKSDASAIETCILSLLVDTAGFISYACFFFPLWGAWPRCRASRSHSVELLWTNDQPDAKTSNWQDTTLTWLRYPCHRRDSNPQSQQASGRRFAR